MKLVSISWVRNEADIIEAFVRHHTPLVERMVIIDNDSKDGTLDSLRMLVRAGFPIDIRQDPAPFHRQAAALTDLMHELAAENVRPDWILPLDADEFLAAGGGWEISDILSILPQNMVTLLPWRTYVPLPSDDQTESNPVRRICHRRSKEQPQYCKALIPRPFHGASYALTAGNHEIRCNEGAPPPHAVSDCLFLAHFPVRSAPQILRKATDGWRRIHANTARQPNEGFHWERMADRFRQSRKISPCHLAELAISYGCMGKVPEDAAVIADPLSSPDVASTHSNDDGQGKYASRNPHKPPSTSGSSPIP